MHIGHYLKRQSEWVRAEYMADYEIHDYPAIAFDSWYTATKQLKIMNRTRTKPLRWVGATAPTDKFRILYYPDTDFRQLWIRQNVRNYRSIAVNFLRNHVGVTTAVARTLHADHVVPRSRINRKHPQGVTVMYFVPGHANVTWGAGHEKRTVDRSLKVRSGITLVSVAKAIGLDGVSRGKSRTYTDVARELIQNGVSSKMYEDDNFFSSYTDLEKVSNELGCAADDPAVHNLKGRPTEGIKRPERMITRGDIVALCDRVPEVMEDVLGDHMQAQRRQAIQAWVHKNQRVSASGSEEMPLKSARDLLLSDEKLFPMGEITKRVTAVLTPLGAVAYLLEKASVASGQSAFLALAVSAIDDYRW